MIRKKKLGATALEDLVDHRFGPLGSLGGRSDMRRPHEPASSNADARLAVQIFCYSVRKRVAAMTAAPDGVDPIVFTRDIGENDGEARREICRGLSWIGVSLDDARNRTAHDPINDPASRGWCAFWPHRKTSKSPATPGL